MQSVNIRQKFLDFFLRKNHMIVPSSSLVPENDPTLLFTNAGMVQFKEAFLGVMQPLDKKICSAQKVLRVSGKHNDLESVGQSPFHHTFFEMLGNFSFGDYFKREAISYAWELLTDEFHLPVERLWITVYHDDEEAAQIWQEVGVSEQRILQFGEKENFWTMGDTGPCGPCSEVHYYLGSDVHVQSAERINIGDEEYVEVWNLVFMQYNRDHRGHLTPLHQPAVDTGMGLERLACILQGVRRSYETDLFVPIIQSIVDLLGRGNAYYYEHPVSYQTIADHSRAIVFLLADGVHPNNVGRGYVLRRLIRRAAYLGKTLGVEQPFLADIAHVVVENMGEWYPELRNNRKEIYAWISDEEIRFHRTLTRGLQHLQVVSDTLTIQGAMSLPGDEAFKLHDTYGFPLELTVAFLKERGLSVNIEEYEKTRRKQQHQSRMIGRLKQRGS